MSDNNSCCNEEQTAFGVLYLIYYAIILVTWDSIIVKPMRLMATFVHEMSHAMMCWITGGNVEQIEVYNNEGGVTRFRGGCRCLITPAGYLGEAFWGMFFTVMSGGRITSIVTAIGFVISLLLALCYSPNRTMVILNLCYALFTTIFIVIEWFFFTPILAFVVLLLGVFLSAYALGDIYRSTIAHTIKGSDAYALHEESGKCCHPKCIGIQWFFVALFMQLFGIWLALVLVSDDCADLNWSECLISGEPFAFVGDLFDGDWGKNWDFDKWFDNR